jgi:hypothetical protein
VQSRIVGQTPHSREIDAEKHAKHDANVRHKFGGRGFDTAKNARYPMNRADLIDEHDPLGL